MQLSHINNVLHVEDEVLIALDVETTLLEAGVKRVIHVATRSDAFMAIESSRPDAVILDIEVLDGSTAGIAELLKARSIPFIVYSGSASEGSERSYLVAVSLDKPAAGADLVGALMSVVTGSLRS
ncbi:hypothetical protein [Devosia sp. LjRoot3]|uniref:hypothetical protein n=1 Tax=Devosia sp. LjRoot3 TaxID=3342319 RepID=UPI003ECE0EFB